MRVAVAKLSELDSSGASKTPWRTVGGYDDAIQAAIPHGDRLYLLTSKDAPNRRVVSVSLARPDLAKAKVEIAEDKDATLVATYGARDALYLVHMVNGLARISRWPWKGAATPLPLPVQGWAPDVASELDRDGLVFQLETWLAPGTYYAYDPKAKRVDPAGYGSTIAIPTPAVTAEEVTVPSADGTLVPLSILSQGPARQGAQPTILFGYAAYGVSQTPGFGATRLAWIERGGVYAICHARGGGEKGRAWQDAGSREHKLRGVEDFIACGEYLVKQGYTTPAKLAAIGVSMGGVLVGRALTLRPDLFAAVLLGSPIVNPLRILAAENGANQKGELGDPATPDGARSIAEMDPYEHVTPRTAYPAVIFTVGLNDHRVAPWMASKLAARLSAATTSGRPVLLRVDAESGHGIGNTRDQVFAERADVWSFFLAAAGEPGFTMKP
jgi:prolyl oligopeptidase